MEGLEFPTRLPLVMDMRLVSKLRFNLSLQAMLGGL